MRTSDFENDTMRRSQLGSDNDSSSSEKASSSSDQPHQSGSSTSSSVRVRASSTSSPKDDGGAEGVHASPRSTDNTASNTKSAGKLQDLKSLFPWTLFMLLEYAEKTNQEYIFSWSPCGTSFKVHKRDDFIDKLLPEFGLLKMTKYKSFVRQLNLWGFSAVCQGADRGCYFHELFVKSDKEKCLSIRRRSKNKTVAGAINSNANSLIFGGVEPEGPYRLDMLYERDAQYNTFVGNASASVAQRAALLPSSSVTSGPAISRIAYQPDLAKRSLIASIAAGSPTPLQQLWMQADAEEEQKQKADSYREATEDPQLSQLPNRNSGSLQAAPPTSQNGMPSTSNGDLKNHINSGDSNIFSAFYKSLLSESGNGSIATLPPVLNTSSTKSIASNLGSGSRQHGQSNAGRLLETLLIQQQNKQRLEQQPSLHNLSSISLHSLHSSGSLTRLLLQEDSAAKSRLLNSLRNHSFGVDANLRGMNSSNYNVAAALGAQDRQESPSSSTNSSRNHSWALQNSKRFGL